MQCAEALRVQAFFDGELDALAAADVERHSDGCAECRALLQDLGEVRAALRQDSSYAGAPPPDLRARIERALDDEDTVNGRQRSGAPHTNLRQRPFWMGAFSGLGAAAAAAGIAFFMLAPAPDHRLLDEIVTAHVRSLMPEHLTDVVSTDKHTVKPWFAGHTDVSPAVADFEQQGYRLVGGRADYFDRQRAAVTVYRHGPHVINVFSWASDQRRVPGDAIRNGYHLAFWKSGNLEYCAVSDTGWDELHGLVRLLEDVSAREDR